MRSVALIIFGLPFGLKAWHGLRSEALDQAFLYRENKGQVHDGAYNLRPDILFSGVAGGLTFHLLRDQMYYQIYRVNRELSGMVPEHHPFPSERVDVFRIGLRFVGADAQCKIEKGAPSPDYENFYLGRHIRVEFVRRYATVTYRGVYPGIDLVFHAGEKGQMEYTWVVSPGASPSTIRIEADWTPKVEGAYLVYETPCGKVKEGPLRAWQADGREVPICYRISQNRISYQVDSYDPRQPLYIDPPVLMWATYYPGFGHNTIRASTAVDGSGNVLLASTAYGWMTGVAASPGQYLTPNPNWPTDAYLVKFNSSGARLWGTYLGGDSHDAISSIATANNDTIYVSGASWSDNLPTTSGSHQPTRNPWNIDAFLFKFRPNGTVVWGTFYGGDGEEGYDWHSNTSVAVAPDQHVYLVGGTNSNNGIAANASQGQTLTGQHDLFIAKFTPAGVRVWGRYFGGSNEEARAGASVDVDENGNLFVASYTHSTNLPTTTGAAQTTHGGDRDFFIARFDPNNANLVWSTYYGGSSLEPNYHEFTHHMLAARGGLVVVTGGAWSSGLASPGAFKTTKHGNMDVLILCLSAATGARLWATYYGDLTSDIDDGMAAYISNSGSVYVGGCTHSCSYITSVGAHQSIVYGFGDGFIAKFSSSGQFIWGTLYGGPLTSSVSSEGVYDLVVRESDSTIYVAGATGSNCHIATTGAHISTRDPNQDGIFLAKFCQGGPGCTAGTLANPCTGGNNCIPLAYQEPERPAMGSEREVEGLRVLGHPSRTPRVLVTIEDTEVGYYWMLHDMNGRLLEEGWAKERELPIQLGSYPAGRYMVTVISTRIYQAIVERPKE